MTELQGEQNFDRDRIQLTKTGSLDRDRIPLEEKETRNMWESYSWNDKDTEGKRLDTAERDMIQQSKTEYSSER